MANRGAADRMDAMSGTDLTAAQLKTMTCAELRKLADESGLDLPPGLSSEDLVFEILKARIGASAPGYAQGVLEVLPDGFGFLRSPARDYRPGSDDVYVSPSQIRRLNLKPGHVLSGPMRAPAHGEKYLALSHVDLVNGASAEDLRKRTPFSDLAAGMPRRRLRLAGPWIDARIVGCIAPWGLGQRVLIEAPPRSGRTLLLSDLAEALELGQPEVYQIVCLIDERPEDAAEMRARLGGSRQREVVATTFDEPPARHLALSDMVLARAMRMVEAGENVILVLDSLTDLVRACAIEQAPSGRVLAPGLDAGSFVRAKRLFAAARQIEGGGSLTVVATVSTGTDSPVERAIAEEFERRCGSQIVLDRSLAEQRILPAIDVLASGTRREECLLSGAEIEELRMLRQELEPLSPAERIERLRERLRGDAGATPADQER
ncbi:MAG: transcription termination factor Rho [Planctomycetota bacterium]